jgi:heterodisulfide reductase subunit A-like polyferredoxin
MLVPSRYRAVIDGDICTGCGLCVEDCPMGVITIDEQNIAMIDAEACIGCGVCTHVCPTDTISLKAVRQEDFIPS